MSTTPTPQPSSIATAISGIEQQITTWAPTAIQTAQAAAAIIHTEATSPNDPGATKLGKTLGLILLGGQVLTATQNPASVAGAIGGLVTLIGSLVKGFNDAGFFSHKPKAAATPVTAVPATAAVASQSAASVPADPAATQKVPFAAETPAQKLGTILSLGLVHAKEPVTASTATATLPK